MTPGATGRAVVLVGNPAAPYSRGLRLARALASAGYAVEIAAVASPGLPDTERDGDIEIRRYHPSGWLRPVAARHVGVSAVRAPGAEAEAGVPAAPKAAPKAKPKRSLPQRGRNVIVARSRAVAMVFPRWFLWPHTVRAWWHALDRELAPADVYHACGSLAIAPALAARERDRKAGRWSIVIYDAIDNVVEGNNMLGMPGFVRRLNTRREAGWARAADGLVTVNEGLADRLTARWQPHEPVLVVPNWPDARPPSAEAPDLIRHATGLPATTRIVLFQGRLGPNLGLEEGAEAVLRLPDAAFALIGFGRSLDECRARDRDPRYAGRHFTLPAVHPDELLAWTASADVSLVALPPVSVNQRQSTPNKFWESLAAGTPVVIGPGLELMERLVREHQLGAVAASLRPDDLAAALMGVLDVTPEEARARRSRIAALAAERFSWGTASAAYLARVGVLQAPPRPGSR
jgi:glycosyltransferase involved in cell wall biosynthesis